MKLMQPALLAGAAAAVGTFGIGAAVLLARRPEHDVDADLRLHGEVERSEARQAEHRRIGAFADHRFLVGRGDDTYQAKLGTRLIDETFTDLGDALRAAQQLGDGPHAIVPFTRSLWFGDGQGFGQGDRVRFDVYAVDPSIREAYGTYSTMTSSTDLLEGAWIQDGADVYGLEPWDGGYSDDPILTKVATLPDEPELFDAIQQDIGAER